MFHAVPRLPDNVVAVDVGVAIGIGAVAEPLRRSRGHVVEHDLGLVLEPPLRPDDAPGIGDDLGNVRGACRQLNDGAAAQIAHIDVEDTVCVMGARPDRAVDDQTGVHDQHLPTQVVAQDGRCGLRRRSRARIVRQAVEIEPGVHSPGIGWTSADRDHAVIDLQDVRPGGLGERHDRPAGGRVGLVADRLCRPRRRGHHCSHGQQHRHGGDRNVRGGASHPRRHPVDAARQDPFRCRPPHRILLVSFTSRASTSPPVLPATRSRPSASARP